MIVALFAGLALAAEPVAPAIDQPKAKPVKDRMVCRETERTGSRLGSTRICKTESQWRALNTVAEEQLDQISRDIMARSQALTDNQGR